MAAMAQKKTAKKTAKKPAKRALPKTIAKKEPRPAPAKAGAGLELDPKRIDDLLSRLQGVGQVPEQLAHCVSFPNGGGRRIASTG